MVKLSAVEVRESTILTIGPAFARLRGTHSELRSFSLAILLVVGCSDSSSSSRHAAVLCDREVVTELSSPPVLRNPRQHRRKVIAAYEQVGLERIAGIVIARMLIDRNGHVQEALIVRGVEQRIDSLAVRILRESSFYPAYLDQTPICFWLQVPMRFPPRDSQSAE
jgi:hypothetical protein